MSLRFDNYTSKGFLALEDGVPGFIAMEIEDDGRVQLQIQGEGGYVGSYILSLDDAMDVGSRIFNLGAERLPR